MDYSPPEHFQMTSPMIKLKSSDGETFEVEVKVAQCFLLIKEMLDDLGIEENDVISIPQNGPEITGAILGKIILWANHHKDDPAVADADEKEEKPTNDISSWDAEFLQVDQSTLFHMIRAANFLNIKGLLDVTCKKVAKMIKGMTLEDVRQKLNIRNDFSPDEEEQILKENAWCEGFSCEENTDKSIDGSLMEKNPAVSVQDVDDNEGGPVVEDCLKNSVILRNVLKHFSNPELLKLSTMNKLWNFEARSVMRERGGLVARTCRLNPCQDLVAFLSDLKLMNVVPFSGIRIFLHECNETEADEMEVLALLPEEVLDRLPLTHLFVQFWTESLGGRWWKNKHCPAFLIAKKMLQYFSGALEEILLHNNREKDVFIRDVIQDCSFPRLKTLRLLESHDTSDVAYKNYVKTLISRAPNLQEIYPAAWSVNITENVLEGSSAVLVLMCDVRAPYKQILESAVNALRLMTIELYYTGPDFNFERFIRLTPMLLQVSCTTLRELRVDSKFLLLLMGWQICLPNLEALTIRISYKQKEFDQPRVMRLLKQFDFTRLFPKLNQVLIWRDFDVDVPELLPSQMNFILEQVNTVATEPAMPDRAANIKTLYTREAFSDSTVEFIAQMLPNIEKLDVYPAYREKIPYDLIWKHWVDLKELEVEPNSLRRSDNFDSVFCGIFPQEVAELRKKDEEYLKRVNIVPVMPAITCMRNLRNFTMLYDAWEVPGDPFSQAFIFSKVTGLIAFARCPNLTVTLKTHRTVVYEAIRHLEAYASVVHLK